MMEIVNPLRHKRFYYCHIVHSRHILILTILLLVLLISASCKESDSDASASDNDNNSNNTVSGTDDGGINSAASGIPFSGAVAWGPVSIQKGYIEDLYIRNNTGIGHVSYNIGESTEDTYIYALNVLNGELIGDAEIKGRCYAVDIGERYAFVWGKDGINIYDLSNKFKLFKTIEDKSNIWISNIGDYLFIEDRQAADYLIDKKTLKDIAINVSKDDEIFRLLYPDCVIGDPEAFGTDNENPAVYDLKEHKIIGYVPSANISDIFAWNPEKHLFFCHDNDKIKMYDFTKDRYISEMDLTKNAVYSIVADTKKNPEYYLGNGDRYDVIRPFTLSSNNCYFFNSKDTAYVLDPAGKIKCELEDCGIIGAFNGCTFFRKDDMLGSLKNDFKTLWLNERPSEPFKAIDPYFNESSIAWLCDSSGRKGRGDGVYQWDYEKGTFLNYTEFTGYEVEILASDPLILAMRSQEGEAGDMDADWQLFSYIPSKLPFNFIPEIKVDYTPDIIYPEVTTVRFSCTVKDLPDEFATQSILYAWDFGDGEKGDGKDATHIYKKSGSYDVSVAVKLGDSADPSIKSELVTVLAPVDFEVTATPQYYSEDGLMYRLECRAKDGSAGKIGGVEWDFGDGGNGGKGTGLMVSHTYRKGSYTAVATIYNYDRSVSWKKEIAIESKFPEFLATASKLEGDSVLIVDFSCAPADGTLPDSGLKYRWTLGSEELSDEKSFEYFFVNFGTYTVILEIYDPASTLVKEQSFNIKVNRPYLELSDGGRKLASSIPIAVDTKYDEDKDGINQAWEDEAMVTVNPYFELDEEEDYLENQDTDKVMNFVRITPYPNKSDQQYILFYYCLTWTRDYGRYADLETGFHAHNGDVEKVVMAWKVIDEKHIELKYVYTSAHGAEETSHSAVWNAKGETSNEGKVKLGFDETMTAALEFKYDILKIQTSEDKHALYPTEECGDDVTLVFNQIGEDCGGGGEYRFTCYNAGEPGTHLMDDISEIFADERIWSGNKYKINKFCGGLGASDASPNTIGSNLSSIPSILKDKIDADLEE